MPEPPKLPLIDDPQWLAARASGGNGGSDPPTDPEPPPDPNQWILDLRPYFDDPDLQQILAWLIEQGFVVTAFDTIQFEDGRYEKGEWTTERTPADGCTDGRQIDIVRMANAAETASVLYHEMVHATQVDPNMTEADREYEAFAEEDEFRIRHGLDPIDESFRTTKDGKVVTDREAVRRWVNREYPGIAVPGPGGTVETVIGKTEDGQTIVMGPDRIARTRDPIDGDAYDGVEYVSPETGAPVDLNLLRTP